MGRTKITPESRINRYINDFPGEFEILGTDKLVCKLCELTISAERNSQVTQHRKTANHVKKMENLDEVMMQSRLEITPVTKIEKLLHGFLAADIPLYKLRNERLRLAFKDLGFPLPCESIMRCNVARIVSEHLSKLKQLLQGKEVFLTVDETQIRNKKFVHVLIGTLENPTKNFLIECKKIENSPTHKTILGIIQDTVCEYNIKRKNVLAILSDAAPYMMKFATCMLDIYPNIVHVTCISHLYHNCAEKIRSNYKDVDFLIASMKALVNKNETRKDLFASLGAIPTPIITRWGTWLEAVQYYYNNFHHVKKIVVALKEEDGKIITNAKDAVASETIEQSLMTVIDNYAFVMKLVEKTLNSHYTILDAHNDLNNLKLENDPVNLQHYILKRFMKNSINTIINNTNNDLSPRAKNLLKKIPSTSVAVERSFSMLGKLLAKDRNFTSDNVKNYMIGYFNLKEDIE